MLLLVIIILFLQWCGYKNKEEVINYFFIHSGDFENIRNYFRGSNKYFSCIDNCNMKNLTWEYIYIYSGLSYWRASHAFEEMPLDYKNYIEWLSWLFTWEIRWIDNNEKFLRFWLNDSLFFIVYLYPQQVKIYDKCSDEEGYFWNITWNWYYSFHEYDICERNKD